MENLESKVEKEKCPKCKDCRLYQVAPKSFIKKLCEDDYKSCLKYREKR